MIAGVSAHTKLFIVREHTVNMFLFFCELKAVKVFVTVSGFIGMWMVNRLYGKKSESIFRNESSLNLTDAAVCETQQLLYHTGSFSKF